ncbi:MAG: thiamine pyrophosphate-dependent enzyme, partial [Acidimicrobiaceae bacterium]
YGHNEGDDPSYTQPLMYKAIAERRSVRKLYVETLVKRGDISVEQAEKSLTDYQAKLQGALEQTRAKTTEKVIAAKPPAPIGVVPHFETGAPRQNLDAVLVQLSNYPTGFMVHPKLLRQFEARDAMVANEGEVDWATAEALAIGS